MLAHSASVPPDGARCTSEYCCSVAVVRMLAHRTAVPVDFCELHWPGVAASLAVRGIALVDTTGPQHRERSFPGLEYLDKLIRDDLRNDGARVRCRDHGSRVPRRPDPRADRHTGSDVPCLTTCP